MKEEMQTIATNNFHLYQWFLVHFIKTDSGIWAVKFH